MKYVFLHGGPGANSLAEQAILGPILQSSGYQTTFWNEPSSLRPDDDPFEADSAFERWLASAEQSVLRSAFTERVDVIAHSFAVHAALEILRRHASRLSTLILVAPAADPSATFRNLLRLAREDLLEAKPDVARCDRRQP